MMKTQSAFLAILVHICSDWYVHSLPGVIVSPTANDCLQKYADVGTCDNAKTKRYSFYSTTKECKVFEYSGCGGNKNNFLTLEDCKRSCDQLIKEICKDVPGNKDPCVGSQVTHKYTYNSQTDTCDKFAYSGCGKSRITANVFDTQSECLDACKSLVFNKATKPELLSGLAILKSVKSNQNDCVKLCRAGRDEDYCIGVAHENTTQVCHLLSNIILGEEQTPFVYETRFDLLIDPRAPVTIVAFRVSSGVGGDPAVVYDDSSQSSPLSEVAAALDMTIPLNKTYRSAILDNWKTYKIKQVVMAYKKSTEEWGKVVFNAENSAHKHDWMKQNNLVSSPWKTFKTDSKTEGFSIYGGITSVYRRFHIGKEIGCTSSEAWFLILYHGRGFYHCKWDDGHSSTNPEIIYAPEDYPVYMTCKCDYGHASEFVLQLKLNVV